MSKQKYSEAVRDVVRAIGTNVRVSWNSLLACDIAIRDIYAAIAADLVYRAPNPLPGVYGLTYKGMNLRREMLEEEKTGYIPAALRPGASFTFSGTLISPSPHLYDMLLALSEPEPESEPKPEPKRMTVDEVVMDLGERGWIDCETFDDRVPVWADIQLAVIAGHVKICPPNTTCRLVPKGCGQFEWLPEPDATCRLTPKGRKRYEWLSGEGAAEPAPESLCPVCDKPASEHEDGLFCCPRCGGAMRVFKWAQGWWSACDTCCTHGPTRHELAEAIKAGNRRA